MLCQLNRTSLQKHRAKHFTYSTSFESQTAHILSPIVYCVYMQVQVVPKRTGINQQYTYDHYWRPFSSLCEGFTYKTRLV